MSSSRFNLEPKQAVSTALKAAAGGIGVGLYMRHQHRKELEAERQKSKLDAKTKLLVYPAFEEEVIRRTGSTERAADRNKTHTLVLLDLDDFKALNTKLTHPRTDREALLPVVAVMRSTTRPDSDLVSRFGGEEFALLLSETDAEGAGVVCEKIQGQINSIRPDQNSADALGATMAFTTFRQGDYPNGIQDIMSYLSEQLLEAKQVPGKNQIVAAPPLEGRQLQLS